MHAGHEFIKKLELDTDLYSTGTFHPSETQPTIGGGVALQAAQPGDFVVDGWTSLASNSNQSYFVGYFGTRSCFRPNLTIGSEAGMVARFRRTGADGLLGEHISVAFIFYETC